MKNLSENKIKTEIIYKEMGNIDDFDISSVDSYQKENKRVFLIFNPFAFEKINFSQVNREIVDRVIVQSSKIEILKNTESKTNTLQLNNEEVEDVLKSTILDAKVRTLSFISDSEIKHLLEVIPQHAKSGKYIFLGDHQCDGCLVLKEMDFNNEKADLISWVWLRSGLEMDYKNKIEKLLLNFILENSINLVIASIHVNNINSLEFFKRNNFVIKSIVLKSV